MTLEEIKKSKKIFLTAEDIAPVIGSDPNDIRQTAKDHPDWLGFPRCRPTAKTIKFPRLPFLEFLGEKERPPAFADGTDSDK